MNTRSLIVAIFAMVLVMSYPVLSLAKDKIEVDPFDISASKTEVKKLGIPTKPKVDALEQKAKDLFQNKKYKAAIPVLEDYAKQANFLANLISANLDPYYTADYDKRKKCPSSKIVPLIPLERLANEYKKKRNIAFAMKGECLVKLGNKKDAIPVLLKALDLLSLDEDAWWKRTRANLLGIIEVKE